MTEHRKARPEVSKRLKDLALYILICTLVLAALAGLVSTGMKWDILFKLLQSLLFPVVLFGIAVPQRRSEWSKRGFWLTVGCALLIHAFLFVALASHAEHLKPVITAALAVPEFLIWFVVDEWQQKRATSKRSGSKGTFFKR